MKVIVILTTLSVAVSAQWDPNYYAGRSVMVHLFEWTWPSIAEECENFLGPKGFGGVQISPPTENSIIASRPWWERYFPMSYNFVTRSGNEEELQDMIRRCNNAGVRVYADVVFNHMGGCSNGKSSTGNGTCYGLNYYDVPYGPDDFHEYCYINDYNNVSQVRNCSIGGPDLDQNSDYVRFKISEMMNRLISFGVAGFRIDAAKNMWPQDLNIIYQGLNYLNIDHGFTDDSKAYIYQEVIDLGGEPISRDEYTYLGRVTEFRFSNEIGRAFGGMTELKWLVNWGEAWGFVDDIYALVFVDNHDNQRHGGSSILTYKSPKQYKMAIAFKLAHTYGSVRMMSSYDFVSTEHGPPQDANGNIIPPEFNPDYSCTNGWVCEHRWRQIYNMVEFKNVVEGTIVRNWWDNGSNQIAFCRGRKGFIAFNSEGTDMNVNLQTCLPVGTYCDVISGSKAGNTCTGKIVTVDVVGKANIVINRNETDGVLAIHEDSKIEAFK